eukprot:COSAG02_NODE_46709_length_346_cov_16.481781_1_plen_37_part_01
MRLGEAPAAHRDSRVRHILATRHASALRTREIWRVKA